MGNAEPQFDLTDREETVRMTRDVKQTLTGMDAELAKLRQENARLCTLNGQLREALGLCRQEVARQKASSIGTERRCSIAETMASELMLTLEQMSMPTPRRL